jgi:predicted Rossmann fold nucleotide-binding protein DprA/Smf involved in DNA uptake
MELVYFSQTDALYPPALPSYLAGQAPADVAALGNLEILAKRKLALFCSVKCPGDLILKTYDAARELRDAGVTVIGGFHSPMEKECLALLLRGRQSIIICPARGLEKMRLPEDLRKLLDEGRLLLLSPFGEKDRRINARLAIRRNEFVAALADEILVAYAEAGGKTERFCHKALEWRKPLFMFESREHEGLLTAGAEVMNIEEFIKRRRSARLKGI